MDTLPSLLTIGGVTAVVIILIQLIKPYLPDDNLIRLVACALGIVLALVATWVAGAKVPQDWLDAVLRGLLGGFSAVGAYNTLNPVLKVFASRKVPPTEALHGPR